MTGIALKMTDAALTPTPNDCELPRIRAQFATFNDAIDYAAKSRKGLNFHDMRGQLERVYPYSEMREDAHQMAYRMVAAGIKPKDRVALIAETGPDFAALFCACVYIGAWPVPLPLPTTFGGKESYIDQLAVQLQSSDPVVLIYPEEIGDMASAAAQRQGCSGISWQDFAKYDAPEIELPKASPDDICYLQYSSGSTRFPTGVAVTHEALLHNLRGHAESMEIGTVLAELHSCIEHMFAPDQARADLSPPGQHPGVQDEKGLLTPRIGPRHRRRGPSERRHRSSADWGDNATPINMNVCLRHGAIIPVAAHGRVITSWPRRKARGTRQTA